MWSSALVYGLNYGMMVECVALVASLTVGEKGDKVPEMWSEPAHLSFAVLMED